MRPGIRNQPLNPFRNVANSNAAGFGVIFAESANFRVVVFDLQQLSFKIS